MSLSWPTAARGPILDLDIPPFDGEVIVRNRTTEKLLALALDDWSGGVLSLDFPGRSVIDGEGVDRSGLIDPVNDLLWDALPFEPGENVIEVETRGGPVTVDERFDQSAGALNGKAIGGALKTAGPRSPTITSDSAVVGGIPWSNPNNAQSENGVGATSPLNSESQFATTPQIAGATGSGYGWVDQNEVLAGGAAASAVEAFSPPSASEPAGYTSYIFARDFDFSIPDDATILGVYVEIRRRRGANSVTDRAVRLMVSGTLAGELKQAGSWPTTHAYQGYGGAFDQWGFALTPNHINSAFFGAGVSANLSANTIATVDHIRITVYYYRQRTNRLSASGFGFTLPSGATVKGIKAEVRRRLASGAVGRDERVSLMKGGAIQAGDKASPIAWGAAYSYASYGAENDLWGSSWLFSDINASNFGVQIAGQGLGTLDIDHVRLTVYYEEAGQLWVTSGDATDFTVDATNHWVSRTEVSDAAGIQNGRLAVAPDVRRGQRVKIALTWLQIVDQIAGVLLRYTDASNFAAAYITAGGLILIVKRVAGVTTTLVQDDAPVTPVAGVAFEVHGFAFDDGRAALAIGPAGGLLLDVITAEDADLASGGALDDGKPGFFDHKPGAVAATRIYDSFRENDLAEGSLGITARLRWTEGFE